MLNYYFLYMEIIYNILLDFYFWKYHNETNFILKIV
jgi:hypothetical protein